MIANNLYNDPDPKIQRPWPWQSLKNTHLDWNQSKDAIQEEIVLLNKGRYTQKEYLHQFSSKMEWEQQGGESIARHVAQWFTQIPKSILRIQVESISDNLSQWQYKSSIMQLIDVVTIYSCVTWFRHIGSQGNHSSESKTRSQHP